jgi:hypothetical protein
MAIGGLLEKNRPAHLMRFRQEKALRLELDFDGIVTGTEKQRQKNMAKK